MSPTDFQSGFLSDTNFESHFTWEIDFSYILNWFWKVENCPFYLENSQEVRINPERLQPPVLKLEGSYFKWWKILMIRISCTKNFLKGWWLSTDADLILSRLTFENRVRLVLNPAKEAVKRGAAVFFCIIQGVNVWQKTEPLKNKVSASNDVVPLKNPD